MECNIFACLEIHLTIGFSQKTDFNALAQLLHNNAVRLLNKAKSRLFRSIMNFKIFENHVDFVSQPASCCSEDYFPTTPW